MSKFDPKKPVRTRDGREACILVTDLDNGTYPIVAAIKNPDGSVIHRSFASNGKRVAAAKDDDSLDLVNIPERAVRYINVGPTGYSDVYSSLFEAACNNTLDLKATVEVIFEADIPVSARLVSSDVQK